MRVVKLFLAVALIFGAGQFVNADDGHEGHEHGSAKRDQLRVAVQGICPMSGEKLGEHGAPIKVKVGQETVFVCCKGCLKDKIDPQHWATIHSNIAKAQGICPIMKKALPKNPKWTFVNGQIVFVCCPPCTKKVAAAPEKHLKKIDDLYTASLAKTAAK